MHLVVEFTDDKELAVIPESWLDGRHCALWPPYKSSSRIMNAVSKSEEPGDTWKSFPIRELYRSDNYQKAREKLSLAEVQSDLQTVSEDEDSDDGSIRRSKRRRRSPDRFSSDDSSSDEGSFKSLKDAKRSVSSGSMNISSTNLPLPQPPERITPSKSLIMNGRSTQLNIASPTPQHSSAEGGGSTCTTNTVHTRDLRLFTVLEKIKTEQQKIKRVVDIILQRLDKQQTAEESDSLPENITFPLSTNHDVDELEIQLENKEISNCVVNHLAVYGGRNVKETVCRLLKGTMTNSLAESYNWHGKKGKLSFGSLKLMTVIYKCVQRNTTTKMATLKDVEVVIKVWLRGAKDRDGGRKRRLQANGDNVQ